MVSAGALITAAADPGIRRGVSQLYHAVDGVIRNPPMEWEDPETGEVAETERMSRRLRWRITRPIWFYTLGAHKLPCGCTRRFRITLYSANCTKHGSLGAYRRARRELLDYADWDDIREVTDRLARNPGDSGDLAAAREFLSTQDRQTIARVAAALVGWLADTEPEDDDGR